MRILAHIVLYRSPKSVELTVRSLLDQDLSGHSLTIVISDNASGDDLMDQLEHQFGGRAIFNRNAENLGFAAAQNWAAAITLKEGFDFLFMVNPDSRFEKNAILELVSALELDASVGIGTPLLYRANQSLEALEPRQVDAAGMMMTRSLRHFDCEVLDLTLSGENRFVFGATGAALIIKRSCIESLLIDVPQHSLALYRVYPQLKQGVENRAPLFDEGFFAFREDADLSWRAQLLGWNVLFVPKAIGYHTRHVLPERRAQLSSQINSWSVRNRFLMQVNNYSLPSMWHCVLPGLLFRNLVVIAGVLFKERSSLAGLREFFILLPRALARRKLLLSSARVSLKRVGSWFR